jgi:methyl-accepting chemotaxis protein
MKLLNNLRIRDKLLILALLPLAVALYFAAGEFSVNQRTSNEMATLEGLANWASKAGALVHEVQKERGMTAGFLGSKGAKFSSEIISQRKAVDNRLSEMQAAEKDLSDYTLPQEFARATEEADRILRNLNSTRSSVSSQDIATKEAISYFTSINTALLDAVSQMAQVSRDVDLTWRALAYVTFMRGKERAGIERAVLSGTFAADRFSPGGYKKFVSLVTEQDTYFREFLPQATTEQRQFYRSSMKNGAVDEVLRMRNIADANSATGKFGIDATDWFKTITTKINLLKDVENRLADDFVTAATEKKNQATSALTVSIATICLSLLITGFLTFVIIRRITGALKKGVEQTEQMTSEFEQLVVVMDSIANNDLTQEVQESKIVIEADTSKDEIGDLSRSIARTLRAKGAIEKAAGAMRSNLHKTVTTLGGLVTELASAATEIASSSEQISHTSRNQSNEVGQISTAVEEMTATILQASKNAESASEASRMASETAANGGTIVNETTQGMGNIAKVVQDSAGSVNKLTDSAQEIGEIIDVIDGIADQTNLLALNAAIEAARAGEQGRGFAVVADEVRKLADRTGTATQEIFGMIKTIQKDTGEAAHSMESGISEVQSGRELAEKAGNSLDEIVTVSQQVMDMIQQIATATEEQSAASEQISRGIERISTMAAETAGGTEMSAKAAEDLSKQAEKLQCIVGEFSL